MAVRGAVARLYTEHPTELLISGPAGTGKDVGVGLYLRTLCEDYPKCRIAVLRKTRRSLTESWLVTWEDIVLPDDDPMLAGGRRANRHSYDHPNGATVVPGGMDEPMKFFSSQWDVVYVQEANEFTLDEWEKIKRGLRNFVTPWQQLIGSCNPTFPSLWLYQRAIAGTCAHWVTTHADNPMYYTKAGKLTAKGRAYLTTLSQMTGTRRKRLYDGLWVASEGQVFDQWNRDIHAVARSGPWRRVLLGVDDGYTHPFAVLRVCVDGDGRAHVEREVYRTGMQTAEKVAAVKSMADGIEVAVVDSAAATLIADLRAAGVSAVGQKKNAVPEGADTKEKSWIIRTINKVQARLVPAGDGKPRLTVDPFCVNLCREFEAYERKLVDGVYQEMPEDADNHAIDSLRGVVDTLDPDLDPVSVTVHGNRPILERSAMDGLEKIEELAAKERADALRAFVCGESRKAADPSRLGDAWL